MEGDIDVEVERSWTKDKSCCVIACDSGDGDMKAKMLEEKEAVSCMQTMDMDVRQEQARCRIVERIRATNEVKVNDRKEPETECDYD